VILSIDKYPNMILDYDFNQYSRRLDVSYIDDNGAKQLLSFNVNRFKAYYSTPTGKYKNWAGDNCDIRWVEKPSKFEIHTFLTELDDKYKSLLAKRTFPKVYAFDIETLADENGEYSAPEYAKCPISTISVCSPELNTIVLGTLPFNEVEKTTLEKKFTEYMENTAFFKKLNKKMPYVKYVYFPNEEEMLKYFLSNIVAKVPILTGWNCIKFDWNYIVNRIKNFYPLLSIKLSSCKRHVVNKRYTDRFGNEIKLPMPEHTLILDMMDIIENEDKTVLPMKESMTLDYIASASMGIHKIEYSRSLDDLYRDDYGQYVFYNSIDSVLVQLINYRFKSLDHIYLYSLYCNEKIASCFSKIAVSEALVFKDFYELGMKIVYEERTQPARSALLGAYVKKPVPGIHSYVSCNDFAALYPSSMRTCNLSFENYVGAFWGLEKLAPYKANRAQYIVIGPNVLLNEGSAEKPKLGRVVYTFLDETKLAPYRADTKNYFVSVNGCVYKNDMDYSFKRIQSKLQAARDHDKYLGKKMDATILSDIDKALEGHKVDPTPYSDDIIETLVRLGIDGVTAPADITKMGEEELKRIRQIIHNEVVYLDSNQLAMKLMMNSIYGGASNINFYWYNMNLANDITGEARDLIHKMENHIPEYIKNNWTKMTDLHAKLGIEVDQEKAKEVLKNAYYVPKEVDPDTYNEPSFVLPIYGDTDSANALTIIKLRRGDEKKSMTIEDWFNDNLGDIVLRTPNGSELIPTNDKVLNYSKDGKLKYHDVSYIMRHKVTKPKWRLKTKSGKEIIVTNDHSMIVFRDGKKITVKPNEILPTDKILVVKDEN
jgi:DNA polymerase elongation subunit (family B)